MNGRISALLTVLLLTGAALLFFNRAGENARRVNWDITRTDQDAYINQAIRMRNSDYAEVTPRNRMPIYPGLLSVFLEKGATAEKFFDRGKQINTWLAFVGLIGLGAVYLLRFPRHHALNILFLIAFTVFLFKAPYVQAEILYYLLTFAVFLLMWRLFRRPGWVVALLAGGLLGLAHLTKASVLPGLLVILVFYPLDALWMRCRDGSAPGRRILVALVLGGSFFATVYPYISTSKAIFGYYFYNVNSTFYFWTDSWKEAKSRTKDAGDRTGWPDLPADELPSFSNYVRTHTMGEISWRVVNGISLVFNSMAKKGETYGYLVICLAYLAFAGLLALRSWRLVLRVIGRRPMPALALLAYFCGYYLLVAWYTPVINGNRFILGLFLPFLFTMSALIVPLARRWRWNCCGWRVDALGVFNSVLSVWIAVEILINCIYRIPSNYGGS